jgi:hypothetical protein
VAGCPPAPDRHRRPGRDPLPGGARPIGDFGGVVLPLGKALEYIETSGWFGISEPWWSRFARRLLSRRR